jgi:hypothetical protein
MATIEVPLSISSAPSSNYNPIVAIAKVKYQAPSFHDNSYWFSVYDRYTLKQVFSQVQVANADVVPADLAGKFNTPQYFVAVTTRSLLSAFVPAGALLAFLVDSGASTELKKLTQVFQLMGSGTLGVVTYAMAGVLGPGAPAHARVGQSAIGPTTAQFLEATLVGVAVGSQTLYTPVPLTATIP